PGHGRAALASSRSKGRPARAGPSSSVSRRLVAGRRSVGVMADAPKTRDAHSRNGAPTTADRVRAWAVLLSLPITIAAAALGGGLFGGERMWSSSGGALSDTASPIAPDGLAFSIWSVIYFGVVAYAVWQVLPKQHADRRQRANGWLAIG